MGEDSMPQATRCELSSTEIDRYCRTLLEELELQAPGIRRQWGQIGEDFLEEAPSHVFQQLQNGYFNPDLGEFLPWCRAVLRRLLCSIGRSDKRRRAQERPMPPKDANGNPTGLGTAASTDDVERDVQVRETGQIVLEPFSRDDLQIVGQWDSMDRVVLLSLCRLWHKVSSTYWQSLVQSLYERGLIDQPLPIEQLVRADSPSERIAILAKALGMRSNTLSVRWRRRKHLLEELQFIRELRSAV